MGFLTPRYPNRTQQINLVPMASPGEALGTRLPRLNGPCPERVFFLFLTTMYWVQKIQKFA